MLLGKGMMINWADVAPEHRAAYYEWHSREHMLGRVRIDGFQRGRRYRAVNAQRDFLNFYEVDDIAVLTGPGYLAKANAPSALTQRSAHTALAAMQGGGDGSSSSASERLLRREWRGLEYEAPTSALPVVAEGATGIASSYVREGGGRR